MTSYQITLEDEEGTSDVLQFISPTASGKVVEEYRAKVNVLIPQHLKLIAIELFEGFSHLFGPRFGVPRLQKRGHSFRRYYQE